MCTQIIHILLANSQCYHHHECTWVVQSIREHCWAPGCITISLDAYEKYIKNNTLDEEEEEAIKHFCFFWPSFYVSQCYTHNSLFKQIKYFSFLFFHLVPIRSDIYIRYFDLGWIFCWHFAIKFDWFSTNWFEIDTSCWSCGLYVSDRWSTRSGYVYNKRFTFGKFGVYCYFVCCIYRLLCVCINVVHGGRES